MESNFITVFLGFVEGFCLISSPCILAVLPVFLAASLKGTTRYLLGMIMGFPLSFTLLIFFSKALVNYSGINFAVFRGIGYTFIILIGVVMLSTALTEKFNQVTQGLARFGSFFSSKDRDQQGFFHGLFLGGLIAIIWTPCAGPILAAIIVQTVIQQTNLLSLLTLLAFALGAVIPMFIISLYGRKLTNTFIFFKTHAALFRKFLGGVLILGATYMMYFANTAGSLSTPSQTGISEPASLVDGLWHPYSEPQIVGISDWINSPPLKLSDLKGKVILIDFWTYSCINCLRSIPYIKSWYRKYHDKGLIVIGIHTPEFDFEKDLPNVTAAVRRDGILYPVALDNQFKTWINFNNHYWPAHYLINKQGDVVYEHFGEGDYHVMEGNIQFLLGINKRASLNSEKNPVSIYSQTPETYLGYDRADVNQSPNFVKDKISRYYFAGQLPINAWGLKGLWQVNASNIVSEEDNAAFKIHFNSRQVFMVMGNSAPEPIQVTVRLNNVTEKNILVNHYSIYQVVSQDQFSSGNLEIIAARKGLKIYTVTFGNMGNQID